VNRARRDLCGGCSAMDIPTATVYRVAAEGILTVGGTPTSSTRWLEGTQVVTVSDGRLTVTNAAAAQNNKICFIEITQQ
jgi:hypothetical protein